MDRQSGRCDDKPLRETGLSEHDDREELDPDLAEGAAARERLKFASTGGAPGWQQGAANDERLLGGGARRCGVWQLLALLVPWCLVMSCDVL
jgi:hypothetical protein